MKFKIHPVLILVIVLLFIVIVLRPAFSGYDPKCNRTVREGAMCYDSLNKLIEPAVTDVESCCNTEGNKWQLSSQIE